MEAYIQGTRMQRWLFCHRNNIAILSIVFVALIALAACGQNQANLSAPTVTLPSSWKTYQDTAKTFTVRVPMDWQVQPGEGGTFGNTKLGAAIDFVGYRFAAPAPSRVFFDVAVGVYHTSQQRALICQSPPFPADRTFHGLPATNLPDSQQWFIYAQNAYFMLNDYYPGVVVIQPGGPILDGTPTPAPTIPAAQIQENKAIIDAILASFTPQPDKPLVCL